jgi:hypothetical protein
MIRTAPKSVTHSTTEVRQVSTPTMHKRIDFIDRNAVFVQWRARKRNPFQLALGADS